MSTVVPAQKREMIVILLEGVIRKRIWIWQSIGIHL